MPETKNKKFITKLKHARENLYVLEHTFAAEEKKLKKKTELIKDAKANIDDLLYELTGDEFYRNKSAGKEAAK